MTIFRLTLAMYRLELIVLAAGVVVWIALAILVSWQLFEFEAQYPDCFGLTNLVSPACETAALEFAPWDQAAELLQWGAFIAPFMVGTVLGAPLVAREIEQQTAQFAWWLSQSRTQWLFAKGWPVICMVGCALILVAIGGHVLGLGRAGGEDPGFLRYEQRGVIVLGRGIMVAAVAALAGVLIGRTLPAVIAGLLLSVVLMLGVTVSMDVWRRTEAVVVRLDELAGDPDLANGLVMEHLAVRPDGSITEERRAEQLPTGSTVSAVRIVPSSAYWKWTAREVGVLLAATLVVGTVTAAATERRRP